MKATPDILRAEIDRVFARIAEIPREAQQMRAAEAAERAENLARGLDPGPETDRPSDGLLRQLSPLRGALVNLWMRYVDMVGPSAWYVAPTEGCGCRRLSMTSRGRLACAEPEGCGQAFEFSPAVHGLTATRVPLSHAAEALGRAERRQTIWLRANARPAWRIHRLAREEDFGADLDLYVEVDRARPAVLVGYRWLRALGIKAIEPEVATAEPPRQRPAESAASPRGDDTFPPSVRAQAGKPATRRRKQ